jgi:hypothetical protein
MVAGIIFFVFDMASWILFSKFSRRILLSQFGDTLFFVQHGAGYSMNSLRYQFHCIPRYRFMKYVYGYI